MVMISLSMHLFLRRFCRSFSPPSSSSLSFRCANPLREPTAQSRAFQPAGYGSWNFDIFISTGQWLERNTCRLKSRSESLIRDISTEQPPERGEILEEDRLGYETFRSPQRSTHRPFVNQTAIDDRARGTTRLSIHPTNQTNQFQKSSINLESYLR